MIRRIFLLCLSIMMIIGDFSALLGRSIHRSSSFENFSQMYSRIIVTALENKTVYEWHEVGVKPFDELIVSWNALRPKTGKFVFWVRVKTDDWSSWLKVAEWGAQVQHSFSSSKDACAKVDIDVVSLLGQTLGTEFIAKVEAVDGALLKNVHNLCVCVSNSKQYRIISPSATLQSGTIENVPLQSQMVLAHSRASSLCSPTSTSIALSFLLNHLSGVTVGKMIVDPIDFAELVRDDSFDIYGNWVLNAAAAYDISGGKILCHVERLAHFNKLHEYLKNDIPVVVSIKGPLKGGAKPYKNGHLMVVIGWDGKKKKILCVDPAFSSTDKTKVWYNARDFLKAWGRRRNLSYIFMPLS